MSEYEVTIRVRVNADNAAEACTLARSAVECGEGIAECAVSDDEELADLAGAALGDTEDETEDDAPADEGGPAPDVGAVYLTEGHWPSEPVDLVDYEEAWAWWLAIELAALSDKAMCRLVDLEPPEHAGARKDSPVLDLVCDLDTLSNAARLAAGMG